MMVQLDKLKEKLQSVTLGLDEDDTPRRYWNKSGKFTVKSMYNHLSDVGPDRSFKHLWEATIPLKIKIGLWLIRHNAIATKDNMIRGNWVGDPLCRFCPGPENIQHMFFHCSTAKYVWSIICKCIGLRNRACFEKKLVRSPAEFVCYSCSFMGYWAGLQNKEDKIMLEQGAAILQVETLANHNNGRAERNGDVRMIEAREPADKLEERSDDAVMEDKNEG